MGTELKKTEQPADGYYGEAPIQLGPTGHLDLSARWAEFMHYLYLPVRIPLTDAARRGGVSDGRGRYVGSDTHGDPNALYALPERLGFLAEAIELALADAVDTTPHLDNPYVYVTARRGFACPGNPLNRPGWHCDDFGGIDLNYIWADRFPTRFLLSDQPLDISDDDQGSMDAMTHLAERVAWHSSTLLEVKDGPTNTLLRLSPYVIHNTPEIPEPGGMRSFFKISVSTHRYDLVGNSHNHLLDYNWPMYDRQQLRNQPSAHQNKDYSGLEQP